jgi:hypothetical protein
MIILSNAVIYENSGPLFTATEKKDGWPGSCFPEGTHGRAARARPSKCPGSQRRTGRRINVRDGACTHSKKLNDAHSRLEKAHAEGEEIEEKMERLQERIDQKELEEAAARKRLRNEEEANAPRVVRPRDPEDDADMEWMRSKGIRTPNELKDRIKMLQDVVADFEERHQRRGSRTTAKFRLAWGEAHDELKRLLRIQERRRQRILGINACISCQRFAAAKPGHSFCGQKCQQTYVMNKLKSFYV